MLIDDRVYGIIEIDNPTLLKLINSKPLQRLKGINQHGLKEIHHGDPYISRFEHSLGVVILLIKLKAPIEEQIAGLLHDVPHTAFSHVVDFLFKNDEHNYHDTIFEEVVNNSKIPQILKQDNFDVNLFFNEENFPLLESSIPDLCADRLDYAFRDMTSSSKFDVKNWVDHLIVHNTEIIFNDKDVAYEFSKAFINMDLTYWSPMIGVAFYHIMADILKLALDNNIISKDDLLENDEFVLNKLKNSNSEDILDKLSLIKPDLEVKHDPDDYEFHTYHKVRYVDPKVLIDNETKRVSELFPEFIDILTKHKERFKEGYFIKIV